MTRDFRLILALSITGMAALALEVLWSRALIPWVGAAAISQITTVAMYMFGLFLGAAIGASRVARIVRPRRWFFYFEGAAALWSAVAIVSLPLLDPVLGRFAQGETWIGPTGSVARGVIASLAILPATVLMGIAFPFAIAALQRQSGHRDAAALAYGVNTLGATFGTLLGGFLLLPFLGVHWGAAVIVVLDLLILVVAFRGGAEQSLTEREKIGDEPTKIHWSLVVAVFLGGAIALGLEVMLFRVLGMALGPTAHAFTIVLASYVLGLGVGPLLVKGWVRKSVAAGRFVFVLSWFIVGVAGVILYYTIQNNPNFLMGAASGTSVGGVLFRRIAVSMIVLTPLTIAFGASYAAAVACGPQGNARRAGHLYAILTLGNIVGLTLTALFVIPNMGMDHGILALLTAAFLVPVPVLLTSPKNRVKVAGSAAFLALVIVPWFGPTEWNWKRLNSAPYMPQKRQIASPFLHFLFFEPGFETTVAVEKIGDDRWFTLDGKVDGSNSLWDQTTQSSCGLLPTLLHPNPEQILIIGMGTGQTAATALRLGAQSLDCAELSESVVRALPYFADINDEIWNRDQVNILQTDGRTLLRYGAKNYDLIISEPSNIWVPGVAHLFTRESFMEARTRLKPGGILMQWLHAYALDRETFRTVVRTLLDVFPYVSVWTTSAVIPEALFLASNEPIQISWQDLENKLSEAQLPNYLVPGETLTAVSVLRNYVAGTAALRKFAGAGPLSHDSLPSLEYAAESSLIRGIGSHEFHQVVLDLLEPPTDLLVDLTDEQRQLLDRRATAARFAHETRAKSQESTPTELKDFVDQHPDDRELRFAVAETLLGLQSFAQANLANKEKILLLAKDICPQHPEVLKKLVSLLQVQKRWNEAERALDELERHYWRRGVFPLIARGDLHWSQGQIQDAFAAYQEALKQEPDSLMAHLQLARLYTSAKQPGDARTHYRRVLELDPTHEEALASLR